MDKDNLRRKVEALTPWMPLSADEFRAWRKCKDDVLEIVKNMPINDPAPQPTDGPEYHAEYQAWLERRGGVGGEYRATRPQSDATRAFTHYLDEMLRAGRIEPDDYKELLKRADTMLSE